MYRSVLAISALVASISIGAASASVNCANDPVAQLGLDPVGIIKYWNYTAEEHWVTSEDGYIVHMVRVTGKKGVPATCSNKEPVIVHHGLLCTSTDWFVLDAPKNQGELGALPFMLVDAGYDVWLPSSRGSTLSLNHTTLSIYDVRFWQFSFNEMGRYDVPAIIDRVINVTGQPKVSWVGHSQGTAVFFIANHYHPELKDKVRKMAALAPAAYVQGSTSPVVVGLSPFPQPLVETAFIIASNGAVLPTNGNILTNEYAAGTCSAAGVLTSDAVCQNALYAIAGFPKDGKYNMDDCIVPRVVSHTPATTSIRCITHYEQTKQTGQFKPQCNNIGNVDNSSIATMNALFSPGADAVNQLIGLLNKYSPPQTTGRRKKRGLLSGVAGILGGTVQTLNNTLQNLNIQLKTPCAPEYKLNNTQVPVLVMCGDSDSLVVPNDCLLTASKLGGPVTTITVANFEHLDFTYANNATNSVNTPVLAFLNDGKPQC